MHSQVLEKTTSPSKRPVHDRVFIAGTYIPVKKRTPDLLGKAYREGTLRIYDQDGHRRIWSTDESGRRVYAGTTPKPSLRKNPTRSAMRLLRNLQSFRERIYKKTDRQYKGVVGGFVYVIRHPMWPGWVSVGHSVDPERRLTTYQRGCPYRGYELVHFAYFDNRFRAECAVHGRLKSKGIEHRGEWFRAEPTLILRELASVQKAQRNPD